MDEFKKIYDRILSDPEFREALVKEPSRALRSIGIEPTPEILAAIYEGIDSVRHLHEELSTDDGAFVT